jgi:hypothetical protein
MYSIEQELDTTMSHWMQTKRFTADATTNAAIRLRVQENLEKLGGYLSVASWERAYLELRTENAIPEFRGPITDQPAAASGQNQQQPGVVSLTAEEYYRLPAATIVKNYRTDQPRGFKAAVDKLIAQGKI